MNLKQKWTVESPGQELKEPNKCIIRCMSSISESPIVINQNLIDEIMSLEEASIIVYDNDTTPFQVVFYVLKSVVPLDHDAAWTITYKIHTEGSAVAYRGSKEHCYKIGDALKKINVEFKIES